MTGLAHRGRRELKVFYRAGDVTPAENWIYDFSDAYWSETDYNLSCYHGHTVDKVERCKDCGVPPEPDEYGFILLISRPQPGLDPPAPPPIYRWTCLDCAYDFVVARRPWRRVNPIIDAVLAENAASLT